ncbi:MAG: lysyl oxidase family protein [Thermoleophilia bacterium]|nr:lysyl oxidase family protein [Thermoleophilia bacterium]
MRLLLLPLAALAVAALPAARAATGATAGAVVVASGSRVTTATAADGTRRVELPWLLAGDTDPAVAPGGRHVVFTSSRHGNPEVYVADAAGGTVRRLTVNPRADDRRPAWSPDGARLVWQSGRPGAHDLFVMDADGSRKRALVNGPGDDVEAAWSPDGTRIAFSSNRSGHRDLWAVPASGGEPELLAAVPGAARAPAWSPDGSRIAFSRESAGDADVWVLALASGQQRAVTSGPGWDAAPDWAPDGRSLVFTRAAGGEVSLWTVRADGAGAARIPGSRGQRDPDWARVSEALAPAPGDKLPDLDQLAPAGLVVVQAQGRFRLGFDSSTVNVGEGPLVIHGFRAGGSTAMRAHQVIERRGGGSRVVRDIGLLHYERHEPHFHWHLQDFVRYELHAVSSGSLVARDRKTGFCLIDRYGRASRTIPGTGPPRFVGDCATGRPEARTVVEGSSVGYRDWYPALFHGQDLDLTGLPAGLYRLVHRANPERAMRELRYSNNDASLLLRLSWPGGPTAEPVVRVLRRCPGTARCGDTAG